MSNKQEDATPNIYLPNAIINQKETFTSVLEKRIFIIATLEIYNRRNDENFTKDSPIPIELKKIVQLSTPKFYKQAEELCISGSANFSTLSYAKGVVTVTLPESTFNSIKNYSSDPKNHPYTKIPLDMYFKLNTLSQIHLAEIIMSNIMYSKSSGDFKIPLNTLFHWLDYPQKMRTWKRFNQRFLKDTIKKINRTLSIKNITAKARLSNTINSKSYILRYSLMKNEAEIKFEYIEKQPFLYLNNAFIQNILSKEEAINVSYHAFNNSNTEKNKEHAQTTKITKTAKVKTS